MSLETEAMLRAAAKSLLGENQGWNSLCEAFGRALQAAAEAQPSPAEFDPSECPPEADVPTPGIVNGYVVNSMDIYRSACRWYRAYHGEVAERRKAERDNLAAADDKATRERWAAVAFLRATADDCPNNSTAQYAALKLRKCADAIERGVSSR